MPLDRTGELVDDQPAAPRQRPARHECNSGWLDRDADSAVPCLTCKPHLAHRRPPVEHTEQPDPATHQRGMAYVRAALNHNRTETPS